MNFEEGRNPHLGCFGGKIEKKVSSRTFSKLDGIDLNFIAKQEGNIIKKIKGKAITEAPLFQHISTVHLCEYLTQKLK